MHEYSGQVETGLQSKGEPPIISSHLLGTWGTVSSDLLTLEDKWKTQILRGFLVYQSGFLG